VSIILKIFGGLFIIALLPMLLPAYVISRIIGVDPFSMDGIGVEFLVFQGIAVAVGTLYAGIAIGFLL
jgi:hypothetical protein